MNGSKLESHLSMYGDCVWSRLYAVYSFYYVPILMVEMFQNVLLVRQKVVYLATFVYRKNNNHNYFSNNPNSDYSNNYSLPLLWKI